METEQVSQEQCVKDRTLKMRSHSTHSSSHATAHKSHLTKRALQTSPVPKLLLPSPHRTLPT
jgi:hypothetical protein